MALQENVPDLSFAVHVPVPQGAGLPQFEKHGNIKNYTGLGVKIFGF